MRTSIKWRRNHRLNLLRFAAWILCCLGLTGPARADIRTDVQAAGVVKVCIWPDYYGIAFRDPRTGSLAGIEVDLAQEFATGLGVSASPMTWPTENATSPCLALASPRNAPPGFVSPIRIYVQTLSR